LSISKIFKQELEEFLEFRWQLSSDLIVVIISYLLVIGCFYTAFQIITTENVAANFILYGPTGLLLLGVVLPIAFNSLARKRPLSETGITRKYWITSLILGIVFGTITYMGTLATITLPPLEELFPLVMMALTVGLFESIFFRGWVQLRFEKAFGAIPAIPIAAAFYSLYHVGYGMNLDELWFLFLLGLSFAIAFRITKNVLVLWPFYTWLGGLFTNLSEGLSIPFEASYGFVNVLAWMLIIIGIISWKSKKIRA
jgi:membrane protease YdiL (CAAX protease family)